MSLEQIVEITEHLEGFITDNKRNKIASVLENRTRHLTVVLEDIYQPHNASAVLRSCDCFGVLDVHIIENKNEFNPNPDVDMGSSKWLNLHHYNKEGVHNTVDCLQTLKARGYRVCATSPRPGSHNIASLPLDQPVALVFGTELKGLSDTAFELADESVHIPMFGFTESFNISVSAALCLYELTKRLHESELSWKLSEREKWETRLQWTRRIITRFGQVEDEFYKRKQAGQ
ncbi:MAG: RNA methyltransferase [Bacteroidia bacterium]|nr:RNA methyltransferase [Bacteroidia bacterium]